MPDRTAPDEFLTPEAMLTPGVAGALTMMITNALGSNFAAPRAWTAPERQVGAPATHELRRPTTIS
jgi:hypothetical protein